MENPDTLKMLVNRLPYGLKLKWRDVADRITETEEWEITIEDIDNFVTSKAQESHTPVNGNNQKCPLCNAQHWLSHCDKFKKTSLRDRFNFIRSKNILASLVAISTPNTPPSCIQRIMDQLLILLPEPAEPVLQGLHSKWTIRGFITALSMEEMKL